MSTTSKPARPGELARERDGENDCAGDGDRGAAGGRREEQRGADRHRRPRQHDAGRAEPIEQRNEDQAAAGGADEIGGVDRIDARGEPRNRERDDEAAGEERQRGQRVDGEHQPEILRRVVQADAEPHEEEERDERGDGVDERLDRQQPADRETDRAIRAPRTRRPRSRSGRTARSKSRETRSGST